VAGMVLDASAIIAMIRGERGWNRVVAEMPAAQISSVNAAEVYSKLSEWKVSRTEVDKCSALLADITVPFDADLALRAGALRGPTQSLGLSLGDRACLALAQRLGKVALTADGVWAKLGLGITVEVIR
jgi:ribonuclease VapC